MSLLTIVQEVASRLSLPIPATVVSNTDKTALRLLSLAREEGRAMSRHGPWKRLTAEKTFTTVAQEIQTSAVPSDLDWIIPETIFNRTLRKEVEGPLTPVEWQQHKATLVTRVNPAFRIRGADFLMGPAPSAGETIAYEYVTKNWCTSAAGTAQTSWTADGDLPLLDEELHILGIIWRFRWRLGVDYSADSATYELEVSRALNREGSRRRISTDGPYGRHGSEAIAGEPGNLILTDSGDQLLWD